MRRGATARRARWMASASRSGHSRWMAWPHPGRTSRVASGSARAMARAPATRKRPSCSPEIRATGMRSCRREDAAHRRRRVGQEEAAARMLHHEGNADEESLVEPLHARQVAHPHEPLDRLPVLVPVAAGVDQHQAGDQLRPLQSQAHREPAAEAQPGQSRRPAAELLLDQAGDDPGAVADVERLAGDLRAAEARQLGDDQAAIPAQAEQGLTPGRRDRAQPVEEHPGLAVLRTEDVVDQPHRAHTQSLAPRPGQAQPVPGQEREQVQQHTRTGYSNSRATLPLSGTPPEI